MRRWINRNLIPAQNAVIGIAGIVGVVALLVKDFAGWLGGNPLLAWVLALIFATVTAVLWLRWNSSEEALDLANQLSEGQSRTIQTQGEELSGKERRINGLESQVDSLQNQLDEERQRASDLLARLHPSERDKALFADTLELLPWEKGPMGFLVYRFNARTWRNRDVEALMRCAGEWQEVMVDDDELRTAFEDLRAAIGGLVEWMALEGGGLDDINRNLDDPSDWVYQVPSPETKTRILEGDPLDLDWKRFDQVRDRGEALALEVVEARREFERVGRARGL